MTLNDLELVFEVT